MNRKLKFFVYTLCIIATILISIGLAITLKEFIENENQYNVADDVNYYKVTFNLNGATRIDHKMVHCRVSNNGCKVTLPIAERVDGFIIGYSDNKDDIDAKYKPGETITIEQDISLYAISYKTNTLEIVNTGVDYLEKDKLQCRMYNEEKTCHVTLPQFNKVGYENKGYSSNTESTIGFIYPGDNFEMSRDSKLYPIYSTSSRHRSLSIVKTFTYQNSIIEVESGCTESIYNEYLKYLDGIKKNVPFLLLGNKITFVVDNSFNLVWGNSYVGMNYGPKSLRSVDIRCSNNSYNDYYATMVHEMAHSWDFYYATKLGENISSQSDIINLYNKYKNRSDRPFREYSYSSIYEFVADMMRYYYFKYYVPKNGFSELSYPSDIKKTIEKYICISKNNYNESKCK